ncbi:MAG TPA: AzlC family ABC transporter permease [Thermohalobaculum sp.]|nr:AzlC family ABC transporter permease [Thermohalobaculum sp.]
MQAATVTRHGFGAGLLAALPVLLAVAPFGLIFGILAVEAGLEITQTMAMSSVVIAGASQLAALQLLTEHAPALIAILTGAVVNLRMAMYSASIAVHWQSTPMHWRMLAAIVLTDQSYALSIQRYRRHPGESLGDRLGFFFGVGSLTCCVWILATYLGATLGNRIPPGWGLDFVVPITFIAIVAPMLRGRANLLAAAVAATLAVLLSGLPYGMGLLVAAAAGIEAGFLVPTAKEHNQ